MASTSYTPVPVVIAAETETPTVESNENKSLSTEEELYSQRKCKRYFKRLRIKIN